jgi:flagellar motor protein MotB
MEARGIRIPPRETDVSGLTAEQIIGKIRSFWERCKKDNSQDSDVAPIDFLELLEAYPVSMCSYHMTDSLKLLVAIMYFDSREGGNEGLSMDYLSLITDKSKKTIFDAIREKEQEAKKILEEAKLRKEARELALKELIEEEKLKLKQSQEIAK